MKDAAEKETDSKHGKKLDDLMAALPGARRAKIERRAQELASSQASTPGGEEKT